MVECLDDQGIEVVLEDDALLGGEVAEERRLGDFRGVDDLFDGRGLVALVAEQP